MDVYSKNLGTMQRRTRINTGDEDTMELIISANPGTPRVKYTFELTKTEKIELGEALLLALSSGPGGKYQVRSEVLKVFKNMGIIIR